MLKKLSSYLKVFALTIGSFALTSCGTNNEGITDISNLDYGFCEVDKITDDSQLSLDNDLIKKPTTFEVEENYYFILEMTAITNKVADNQPLILMSLHFGSTELLAGNLYRSDSPGSKESIKDQDTGEDSIGFSIPIKTPNIESETIEIKTVLKLSTLKAGETEFSCDFSSSNTKIIGNNINGLQKMISIKKWKLEPPTITYSTTQLILSWQHVRKTEYYCLYIDGTAGPTYKPNNIAYGSTINWDLTEVPSLFGYHRVRLQSCHTSTNFTLSELSNEVEVAL